MLKYNGSILKLPSTAILDYITPPTLTCTFTGDSTIPMTYSVNGDTFVVNSDTSVIRTLNVGDQLTIQASSGSGKTFSLKGLENLSSTVTWDHKGTGSSVTYSGIVASGGSTVIGYDSYRNKEFTANCKWWQSNGTCYIYQPELYVDTLSTNCLQSGNWNGNNYVNTVSDFTNKSTKTGGWNSGYGRSGWTQYGSQGSWTGYAASSVFNWDQVLGWTATWYPHIISCNPSTNVYTEVYGTYSSGGSNRLCYEGYNNYTVGSTVTFGPYTGSGASNKGPVLCFSIGRGTSNNSVNHEGICTIVGVKR